MKILANKIQDKYGGVPLLLSKYILPKTPWNNLLLRFQQLMDYHCRRKTTNANQKAKSWKNLQFRSIQIRWSATNTQKFHFIDFEITWTCCIIFLESCCIRSGGSSHRYKFENRKRQKEKISVNRPRYTRWCVTNFLSFSPIIFSSNLVFLKIACRVVISSWYMVHDPCKEQPSV